MLRRPGRGGSVDHPVAGTRVLVLEDDAALRQALTRHLRSAGHVVVEAATLAEARAALAASEFHCIVIDRIVPDGDALDLVTDGRHPDLPPVLVVSALGEPDDRVAGLLKGSDDYVSKPVSLEEVALRVRNLILKAGPADREPVQLGRVVVDRLRASVTVGGERARLTPLQYRVLDYLVAHRSRMVATEELLEHCWDDGRTLFADPLHTQVTRLRDALDGWLLIESVRGVGYVLTVVDPEDRVPRRWRRGRAATAGDGRRA